MTSKMKFIVPREVYGPSGRTGLTRSTTYVLMKAGKFPRAVSIGSRRVVWIEAEVDQWIAARVAERDSGARPQGRAPARAKRANETASA